MKSILIANNDSGGSYSSYFIELGYGILKMADFLKGVNPDLICFTGGTDVNPELYGEKRRSETAFPDTPRDVQEVELFEYALKENIPMIGICRGSQFLCVMNDGKLIQHTIGHTASHDVDCYNGDVFNVTSSHHQMMFPNEGKILATCSSRRSPFYFGYDKEYEIDKEVEAVYWENTKCLSVQWHPEWMVPGSVGHDVVGDWIEKFLFDS